MAESADSHPDAAADRGRAVRPSDVDFPLEELMASVVERGGSDLVLTAGDRPRLRREDSFQRLEGAEPLGAEETREAARALTTEEGWEDFRRTGELDFSFSLPGVARFRGNLYRQRGAAALALRPIPHEIPPLDSLGLPPAATAFAELQDGLVLVTGPARSGRSTTLAALVEKINRERAEHIITVEDPIEFLHRHRESAVDQREVGSDTEDFSSALRHVLRQSPDVVLIGELRDSRGVRSALTLAESGLLTFAAFHGRSASGSLRQLIDRFPERQQGRVRGRLAAVLEGVLTQVLLPRADGTGRVAAAEVLVPNDSVRDHLRGGDVDQLRSVMEDGSGEGMQLLNDDLVRLVREGAVARRDALSWSNDADELRWRLNEDG